jgi:hypothetical protein
VIVERTRARGLPGASACVLLLVPLAIVLLSVMLSPASNAILRVAVLAFCILAVVRPADAVLVPMAFIGFTPILSTLAGVPSFRATEALVVACAC